MRFTLSVIAFIFAVMFGLMTVLDGMTVARAGEGDDDDDDVDVCLHDDGDDDEEPNEEPEDDPDSEDNDHQEIPFQAQGTINPQTEPPTATLQPSPTHIDSGPEVGDPEDQDPYYEPDDDCPTPVSPYNCGNMTAPGLYFFEGYNYEGLCLFLAPPGPHMLHYICDLLCTWNDIPSSAKLVGNLPNVYVCLHDPPDFPGGFCEHVPGNIPDLNSINLDNNITDIFFDGDPLSAAVPQTVVPQAPDDYAAADADCDGGVGVGDALTNLQYLSGFEAGCAGESDGESIQGDADCSGAVGAPDVTAILAAVAAGSEAAC